MLMLDPKYLEMDTNCILVQISWMAPTRRGNQSDAEPPPPPSMAEVLMAIEENNDCNNLNKFLPSQPPTFAFAKEPLDADD